MLYSGLLSLLYDGVVQWNAKKSTCLGCIFMPRVIYLIVKEFSKFR
jgi:hypothetical protein